jgi:2-octaprenylphenol hydroxylase
MTQSNLTHDIIISGGGMVGLALSLTCAKQGLRVALVEKNLPPEPSLFDGQYSPRVSAINHASERFLKDIGAWQEIPTQRLCAYQKMHVWDGLGSAQLNFTAADVQADHLGHIIENNHIVHALWQCAYQQNLIDLFTSKQIESLENTAQIARVTLTSGECLSAELIVAAEGKFSPVRQLAGIQTNGWDYQHKAIVTTVKHQLGHQHCAQQVFLETGPLAFLPLKTNDGGNNFSSIVWSAKTEYAEQLLSMSDSDFKKTLSQAFEHSLGDLEHVDARFSFPLTAQHAQSYFQDRVVIVGDAAHTIHPLAGLGVNLGFLDAATLGEELARAKNKKIDLAHPHVLRRYQRQRKSHTFAVAGLMEALKRGFDQQLSTPVLVRNAGMQLIDKSPLLKRPLILAALGDVGTPLPKVCQPPAR